MKHILSLFLLTLCLTLQAASPDVTVTVSDFTLDYSTSARVVRLTPTTAGTSHRAVSDADGLVTFASITPGIYNLSIEGVGVPTLTIRVPSQSETIAASEIVISGWTAPAHTSGTITPENVVASGYLALSGQTNRIADNGSTLTFNGAAVVGWGDLVWTNAAGLTTLRGTTNGLVRFSLENENNPNFSFGTALPGSIGPQMSFSGSIADGTNVSANYEFGSYGVVHNTVFNFDSTDNGDIESLSITIAPDLANGAIRIAATNGAASLSGIFMSDQGTNTASMTTDGTVTATQFKKGSFTGITTTNTFYTTGASGSGVVTNVQVVSGGIVTSWVVTP
jgi:hypothetical protein